MANPAKDARDKMQAKWPGASVSARGRKSITHQHPTDPSRFALDTSIGPLHYGVGEDQEIDTAWQATTGAWDYEMTSNSFQTFARDTFNVGDIFEFQKDGEWLRFDPQSINWVDENYSRQQIAIKQAVTAQVNDDILSFPDAYGSGRHFQYQNQTARLQKLITIDSAANLPAPTVQGNTIHFEAEFSMSLSSGLDFYLDGVLWARENGVRIKTVNQIEIRDAATGTQVLWWLGLPRAYDSDIGEVIGEIEVRRQGGPSSLFITVRIPKTWIDSATFPIYIDPTIDEQVGANYDDAHDTSWTFSNSSLGLSVYADNVESGRWDSGFRFQTVNIANSVTVNTAYWEGYCRTFTDLNCHIYGEDEDDSADFNVTQNVRSRTRTTANVDWDATLSTSTWEGSSVEIKTIIQEIIDRGGWAANQDMTILLIGDTAGSSQTADFTSHDDNSALAAKLHIEYTAAATGPQQILLMGGRKVLAPRSRL